MPTASQQNPERSAGLGAAVAARLLPARADEGHPEGARRPGRYAEGHRRPEGEDRSGRHDRGREEGRAKGAWAAEPDESRGGGLLPDAELCGVAGGAAVVQGLGRRGRYQEGRRDSRRRPLRAEQGKGPVSYTHLTLP